MKVRYPLTIPPIIPVRFKGPRGTKEVDALIDTGASYVILSWEDALHLGYNPKLAPSVRIATAAGFISIPEITLQSVDILDIKRQKVKALVKDLSDTGIQAILGWSFLDKFTIRMDSKKKILEIS